MESSSLVLFAVCSLVLVGNAIAARKDPGEYWKDDVMKDQPHSGVLSTAAKNPADCRTATEASKDKAEQLLDQDSERKVEKAVATASYSKHGEEKSFVKNFGPKPIFTWYDDDEVASKKDNYFVKNFEPKPIFTWYDDDDEITSKKDKSFTTNHFEPKPIFPGYNGDEEVTSKEDKSFVNDFKPKPIFTFYNDDEVAPKKDDA